MVTTAKAVGCTSRLPHTGQIHGDSVTKVYAGLDSKYICLFPLKNPEEHPKLEVGT